MSGQATGWVLRHGPKDRAMRLVLLPIADAANRDGEHAHPGMAAIVEGSLYQRAHVIATLRRLEDEGWIEIEEEGGGRGKATVYRIPGVKRQERVHSVDGSAPETVQSGDPKGSNPERETVQSGDPAPLTATDSTSNHNRADAPEDDEPGVPTSPGLTTTMEQMFNQAIGILARRALTRREAELGPPADEGAWLTGTGRKLRDQHLGRFRAGLDNGELDGITAAELADWLAPPVPPPESRAPADPLATTQQAHYGVMDRNARRAAGMACPRCDDVGLYELPDGTYADCPECAA